MKIKNLIITTVGLFLIVGAISSGYLAFSKTNLGEAVGVLPPVVQSGKYIVPRVSGSIIGSTTVNGYYKTATTTSLCFSNGSGCITSPSSGAGTVTSVGMAVPTGLTVSGVPITTAGTSTITYTAGYSIPLTASTTNGNTAYLSLYATGTSGMVLQTNGTIPYWVATSTLGISGGTGSQTPWTSAIDGGGYSLTNVNVASSTSLITGLISVPNYINFNGTDLNTKIGYQAGKNIVSGAEDNVYIGYQAGLSNTTGGTNAADLNTVVGWGSFTSNKTGYDNNSYGAYSLSSNTTGFKNNAIGYNSLSANTTGNNNTALGYTALGNNTTGDNNTALGSYTLNGNGTGSNNVAIGYYAGGYETGSNAFYVDNQDRTNTAGDKANALLYGQFAAASANQNLTVNAHLNVTGTSTFSQLMSIGTGVQGNYPSSIVQISSTSPSYLQLILNNKSATATSSADIVLGNSLSTDTSYFADFGYNSSAWSNSSWTINGVNGAYLYNSDGDLAIGTASSTRSSVINFFTGGTLAANSRMTIQNSGASTTGLSVSGKSWFSDLIDTASIWVRGLFRDSSGSGGSNGMVLQSTGTSTLWVATSTLGFSGGTGTSQWTTNGSNIYYNTGNVGIGSSTPSRKLIVDDGLISTTTIQYGDSDHGVYPSELCMWNGTNFTILYFGKNSVTPIYSTSTTCNQ